MNGNINKINSWNLNKSMMAVAKQHHHPHRKSLLASLLLGVGLIAVLLAGSKLFVLSILFDVDSAGENGTILLKEKSDEIRVHMKASASTLKADSKAPGKAQGLAGTLVYLPSSLRERRRSRPKNVEAAEVEGDSITTVSSKAAGIKVLDSTHSPKRVNVPTTSDGEVEVLPGTPSAAEAKDVLWVLIVHFTGKPDRFKSVTNTWFKRTHPRMAIMIFTNERNMALMSASGIPTVYYASNHPMTERTLQAMRAALAMFPNAVYISKSDDDAYVYTQRLASTLFSNIPFNYQGQRCSSQNALLKLGDDFKYACGGGGYTLTRYAAEKVVKLSNPPQHADIEDVGVGLRLKHSLGKEFGLHVVDVHWNNVSGAITAQIKKGPALSYHYITPSIMSRMHEEVYHWRPSVRRSPVPKIFHHLEGEPIHRSCREINPTWTIMTWTGERLKELSERAQRDPAFVQYDVLLRHGGIFMRSNDTCKQPLDARLDQIAKDFEHDGYYLAYDFHEHGFRSGLFVLRPFSDLAITIYRFAEGNIRNHPLEHVKASRLNIAILPARGMFERLDDVSPHRLERRPGPNAVV